MARRPRHYDRGIYHIAAHASDDRLLFLDDRDRTDFLDHLALTYATVGVELISYVLMKNHYHSLTYTPDNRIERALQIAHGGYSLLHNSLHRRSAHLFRAHPLARAIKDTDHLLTAEHYIAHNPVEAGIVLDPFDWPWSSAPAHAGLTPAAVPLAEHHLRAAYNDSPNWRRHYTDFIANEKDPPKRAFSIAGAGFEPATSGL
jgi:putative transposase